jgi:hypothetical protein
VVSPGALGAGGARPELVADRLSADYVVALGARTVREVGALAREGAAAGRRVATLAIDTEIGFRSGADRAAFAEELTTAVLELAAKYHHDDGRPHRLVVTSHAVATLATAATDCDHDRDNDRDNEERP